MNKFFRILKVFPKIYQTSHFFSKIVFKVKSLFKIIIKQNIKMYLILILLQKLIV